MISEEVIREAQIELRRRRARRTLIDFVKYVGEGWYKVDQFHEHLASQLQLAFEGKIRKLMIFAPPQHGKLISHDTPILTTDGWKTHGDLKPGDYVFGHDGQPVPVIAVSEEDFADHEIEFSNGEKIKCHALHEWLVGDKIIETRQLLNILSKGAVEIKDWKKGKNRAISKIEKIDPTPGKCIQVEGGVYLVGETLIPTHNSQLASIFFPAFWLANKPDDPIIITSYGAQLAFNFSKKCRSLFSDPYFKELFPNVKLKTDSKNVQHWMLAPPHRGQVVAAGVGGPITGHGARLGIIDDPIENWQQAQSLAVRERVWDWYQSTFRNRIWEDGVIIIIMTRWHEDDLAGRLLKTQAEEWTVLRYTALAKSRQELNLENAMLGLPPTGTGDILGREPGEALAPSRFSADELVRIKKDVGPIKWAAQYDGVPQVSTGSVVKREWFKYIDTVPNGLKLVRYWDLAASSGKRAKRTAGVLMGKNERGEFFILDVVFGKWDIAERNRRIRETALDDYDFYGNVDQVFEREPSASGIVSFDVIKKALPEFDVYSDLVRGSKDTRMEPFLNALASGKVFIFRAGWNMAYIHELLLLPNGEYRDMADATSGAFNWLESHNKGFNKIVTVGHHNKTVLSQIG